MQNGSVERVQEPLVFHLGFDVPGNSAKRFRGTGTETIGFIWFLRYLGTMQNGSVERMQKLLVSIRV